MTAENQQQYGATPGERRAYEMFQLKRTVRRMLRAEERAFEAQETPTFAAVHWEIAWWKANEKYRKQVEDLIA